MNPVWHPLSAVLTVAPPTLASARLLKTLIEAEGSVRLRYAGDRFWPTLRHGDELVGEPLADAPRPGDVVLAGLGVVDVVRVLRCESHTLQVAADAGEPRMIAREELLGRVRLPRKRIGRARRGLHRLLLDVREATGPGSGPADEGAASVRLKYDRQAPLYARAGEPVVEATLLARIRDAVPLGRRILVLGSGTGLECFGLAEAGWQVTGVDFAPAMLARARAEAARRQLDVEFVDADLRELDASTGAGTYSAVLFTYDVYSFLPRADDRVALLKRVRTWLDPEGVVLLSARRTASVYARLIMTLQWLSGIGARRPWGASHTRWLASDGALHRSFIQAFTESRLRSELSRAGFVAEPWMRGHALLRPDASA